MLTLTVKFVLFCSAMACILVAICMIESWCRKRDEEQELAKDMLAKMLPKDVPNPKIHVGCCCDDGWNRDHED